ncbi:MAG TPA: TadE family protein [Sphingomicrobium sp.]|nr:TadE family protein [Sphingomicrobium sp.]
MSNRLWSARSGAIGAEFALILPILLVFLIGIIDVGRFMWTWNRAEKAAQMGVRYASVTDAASLGLQAYDFFDEGVPRGAVIPESSFGGTTCTSTGCTCTGGAVCDVDGLSAAAFTNVVTRMQSFMPEIDPENVTIEYGYSGLGYSGDPYGPDVNPLITVTLTGMTYHPGLGAVFGIEIPIPSFASTLSMEDGSGTRSN